MISGFDWERLFELARYHRVSPVLYQHLIGSSAIPRQVRALARARWQHHARRVLCFMAELRAIEEKFDQHGIRAVCHKGPVLAQLLYGDAAMREFGDLDFLLEARDIRRAQVALGELGYSRHLQLSARQEQYYLRSQYELVFGSAREPNLIELQWQVLPRFYSVSLDVESLLARSLAIEIADGRSRVLCPTDLLLVLCLHAAKHGWAQLGMVRDIARLIELDLDWKAIHFEAQRLGILNILAISLQVASNLLGSRLPQLALRGSTARGRALRQVENRLRLGEELKPESLDYFYCMIMARERWRDRFRFLWRLLATPGLGEWRMISLPNSCSPLYRGV
ncbi:MAG: nucleotidyltransferase family protein, partial [Acidobacteria bacterium]|nr:nucleotidyltransferase family protein [Acidobacteriota bacterium]